MLWDSILEFFTKRVFGGYWPNGDGSISGYGAVFSVQYDGVSYMQNVSAFGIPSGMTISSYFSLIATIITMVIIVILCALFVKKIVSLVGGLIR